MLFWFKKRRRQRLLAEPVPQHWEEILNRNVPYERFLDNAQRARLRDAMRVFLGEKRWEGCGGLEMTDEVRVTIAAGACILLLGVPGDWYFDQVKTLLVYPEAFYMPAEFHRPNELVDEDTVHSGEAWHRGPVILSWHDVYHDMRRAGTGRNVVFHEFAHQIDGLDGEMGGIPPLGTASQRKRWHKVFEREYHRLRQDVKRGVPTLLDEYGASNRAEFFAVSTEYFFDRPRSLKHFHTDLYHILHDLYQQDTASWPIHER